jgi:hypothetical protein
MIDTAPPPTPIRGIVSKLIDSAFVIATIAAALYFAGWTYRQSYYGRFAIDPSSLAGSNVAIAVEGAGAIVSTTAAWLLATLPILIAVLLVPLVGYLLDRFRGTSHGRAFFDALAVLMTRVVLCVTAILLVMAAGEVAAVSRAKARVANVASDRVWVYHTAGEAIHGVTLAQNGETTWLLTKGGIRPIRTADIQLIDGPLFDAVAKAR